MRHPRFSLLAACLVLFIAYISPAQQTIGKFERERGQDMLRMIKSDLKEKYYDPTIRGIDIEARFAAANEKMKTATSNGHIMGIIAQVLVDLGDSHTFFVPPSRASKTEYGWQGQVIGDGIFVTAVKPGSDADAKGLKVGDQILGIDNFAVARENYWLMRYFYYTLRPQPGMKLAIRKPDGKQLEMLIAAKITQRKRVMDLTGSDNGNDIWDLIREGEREDYLNRHRYHSIGKEIFIWRMPGFDMAEAEVDDMMGKISDYKAVIFDLRGNGGGAVRTLNRLIANLFDHDVKIADWKGRKKFDPQIAKTRGAKSFKGDVIVLVDSESGSASEIFARVMQLEKRGTVIGDRSAGKVMVSRYFGHQVGIDVVAFFGASITEADLIMSDGKSLENTGVTPDKQMIPTADDLANGRDPVLSAAVTLLGRKLDSVEAGKLFPIEWAK